MKIGLFLLLLTLRFLLSAQSDFSKGYILTHEGDTLFGLINYKGTEFSARRCTFKKDKSASREVFKPEDISGYRFMDGRYYVSRQLEGDSSMIFLEYLVDGVKDLYYYRRQAEDHYFIEENGRLIELKNEERVVVVDNQRYVTETKTYIGQLTAVFKDSPVNYTKVKNSTLDHRSLIDVTKSYHEDVCPDEVCAVYIKEVEKPTVAFGVVMGYSKSSFYDKRELSFLYPLEVGWSSENSSPYFGLFMKRNMPGINRNINIKTDIIYFRDTYISENPYSNRQSSVLLRNSLVRFEQKLEYVSARVSLRYEFPKGKIRPIAQISGDLQVPIEQGLEVYLVRSGGSEENILGEVPDRFLRTLGGSIGLGFKTFIKSKEVLVDFSRGTFTPIQKKITRNSVSVSYQIF